MIVGGGGKLGEVVVARLEVGEMLLEGIAEVCKKRGIRNGVILTGFGSVSTSVCSGTRTDRFPPDEFYRDERAAGVEVLALSGVVADYHVHAHVVFCTEERAWGGHLEPGCRVLSLCEVALARLEGLNLKRLPDAATGQNLLQVVESYEGLPPTPEGAYSLSHTMGGSRKGAERGPSGRG